MSKGKWAAAGAAAAAIAGAGAALYYWRETSSETPDYRLLDEDGDFELRHYPELLTAGTVTHGLREEALNTGFGILADYIFARARGDERSEPANDEKIEMTAPVLSEAAAGGGWRTRFVMPAGWTRETLPPVPGAISITDLPERRMVAIKFAGRADDRLLADKESELREWAMRNGHVPNGPVEHAFYNSPMIPGPLRRNEILIPVA